MIDHKVVWPEMGFEFTVSKDEDSDSVQRTISYYTGTESEEEESDDQREFRKKLDENRSFRRFVIGLNFVQKFAQIFLVGVLTLSVLSAVTRLGYVSFGEEMLFWYLMASAVVVYAIDWLIKRIWRSPISQISIYVSGLLVISVLLIYFGLKRQGRNLSTIYQYATAQIPDKFIVEELVKTGRKFNI